MEIGPVWSTLRAEPDAEYPETTLMHRRDEMNYGTRLRISR